MSEHIDIAAVGNGTREELADMPWPEYKAFPALNGSTLVRGRKSLLHLKHAWDYDGEDTDAMQWGRMVHCLLFERASFVDRYLSFEGRRAGAEYTAFCERAKVIGAEVVRAEGQYSFASALEAAQGFLSSKLVQQLIAAGQAEQTVLAVEEGMQCKGRIDWVSTSAYALVDLKTTTEIEPELFGRTFFRFGYDLKLGLYQRWLSRITGKQWPVVVIVLESRPPYDVAVVPVPNVVLDNGVEKAMAIIAQVKQAIATDVWPGIARGEPMPLVVPYHEMAEAEESEPFQG